MVKVRRWQIYPNVVQCQGVFGPFGLILISDPLGSGMPFLDSDTCARGGGVIYFCQGFFPCMMPSMNGWQDGRMDGWTGHMMKKASRQTTTTSFTICNYMPKVCIIPRTQILCLGITHLFLKRCTKGKQEKNKEADSIFNKDPLLI